LSEIKKILKGCLAGDRRDQELLYRRHAAKLYAVCLQYSGNDEEARDILQEGFIKIFANLDNYKHEGSFEGWMRRITVNTALEKFRSRLLFYIFIISFRKINLVGDKKNNKRLSCR